MSGSNAGNGGHRPLVLVTGASRGLGRAIAEAFANQGCRVILNYYRERTLEEELELTAGFRYALALRCDVRNKAHVDAMFMVAQEQFDQPIEVVVNCALVNQFSFNGDQRTKIDMMTWQEMDGQMQGAVRAALSTTQAALPGFRRAGRGAIINIGSNLVDNPVVPYHDYTAAKGALLAFTRTTAAELGPMNVTCNMVSGGLLDKTDASAATPQAVFDQIKAVTPMRRVATPQDVAGAVVFFASDAARMITGQNLVVDGGLVMR